MLKLIGVLIIVIGFIRKYDTIAVVLVAGITTGLVSGLGIGEILGIIGSSFIKTRYMSIFLLTLPVIGILERNGLRERAAYLISRMKSATAGKVMTTYTAVRMIAAAFSLRLGGHVQFIRPLVNPMAQGATENKFGYLTKSAEETIKGYAAASENYGNFFGQNIFIASGGVLLVVATLEEQGVTVTPLAVSRAAIPAAIAALVLTVIQNHIVDKKVEKQIQQSENQIEKGVE